jgi:glycosyltransferase involved in cell wall biosynthesis
MRPDLPTMVLNPEARPREMMRATPRDKGAPPDSFKVLIIASLRYPIAEPFAGGLEAHTFSLASGLQARGHSVVVAGAAGSDPAVVGYEFGRLPTGDPTERPDITNHPIVQAAEHEAFAGLMEQLRDGMLGAFDVIHNNALHPFPVEHSGTLPCPLITTLHTPVLPWADRVLNARKHSDDDFVAVSRATARQWHPLIHPRVVRNGVDTQAWRPGPGGAGAVWSGRIAPEKAPHLAIEMAQAAGIDLTIAGPVIDAGYFARAVAPRLSDRVRYVGHLRQAELVDLVGRSAVALVTPIWNEPFGLVAAEAMACGTPVVALARGGLPEIVDRQSGRLLPPADASGLTRTELLDAATAIAEAAALDRRTVRRRALQRCSSASMLRGYERTYRSALRRWDGR